VLAFALLAALACTRHAPPAPATLQSHPPVQSQPGDIAGHSMRPVRKLIPTPRPVDLRTRAERIHASGRAKVRSEEFLVSAPPSFWTNPILACDGQNVSGCASDGNTCNQTTCEAGGLGPCLTCAEIQARIGTSTPAPWPQATELVVMSDNVAGDTWSVQPTPGGPFAFTIQGSLAPLYFTASLTSYTPLVRCLAFTAGVGCTTPGTLGTITVSRPLVNWSTACGGSTCVGADLYDVTSNTQSWIVADLGSGKAAIATPFVAPVSAFASAIGSFAASDTLQVGRLPKFNGSVFNAPPFNFTSGPSFGFLGVSQVHLVSPILTTGPSVTVFNEVRFSQNDGAFYGSNATLGSAYFDNAAGFAICGGNFNGPSFAGGVVQGVGPLLCDGSTLDAGVILDRPHLFGTVTLADAYWTGPLPNTVDNPPWHLWLLNGAYSSTPYLWGPAGLNLDHGSTMYIFGSDRAPGGSYATSLLLTGGSFPALALDGLTTGWAFAEGGFSGPHTLTPYALDQWRGLQQPQTGSKFMTALP
jgi:hypothetical protein